MDVIADELGLDLERPEILTVEERLQAHAVAQRCRRQDEEERNRNKVEELVVEGLDIAAAATTASLMTFRTASDKPVGGAINFIVGAAAKAGSVAFASKQPDDMTVGRRTARAACRAGKTLLHTQLGIWLHNVLKEND